MTRQNAGLTLPLRWRAHNYGNQGGADLNVKLRDLKLLRSICPSKSAGHPVPKWPNLMVVTWTPRKLLSANGFGCRSDGGTERRKAMETAVPGNMSRKIASGDGGTERRKAMETTAGPRRLPRPPLRDGGTERRKAMETIVRLKSLDDF